ncbi:MAG: signal transduction histidine kinase (STHK), LytS [Alkalinema sp. CAN_BIN05]|nr:signal transduction histidine kinase (STHK), LytS [Alkalinema sp. CAN_BIN05]
MITHQQRAMGTFGTYTSAQHALHLLQDSGFTMSQVSLVVREAVESSGEAQDDIPSNKAIVEGIVQTTHVEQGAKAGATTGTTIGGLTGLLVGLGTLAIPGVGPIVLAGAAATAIATTLAGGAIGAASGGLLGGLIGVGIPEAYAKLYTEQVVNGGYLLIVDGTSTEMSKIEELLVGKGVKELQIYSSHESGKYELISRSVVRA